MGAESFDAFFGGDHRHAVVRGECDDLLAQERTAAPLDHAKSCVDLVGAVEIDVERRDGSRAPATGIPRLIARRVVSSLVEIAVIFRPSCLIRSPRRRTRSAEVEPEPRPTIMPSRTKAAAAEAARDLGVSAECRPRRITPPVPATLARGHRTEERLLNLTGAAALRREPPRIGATRFELVTSCSQGRRANQAALRPAIRCSVACYAGTRRESREAGTR